MFCAEDEFEDVSDDDIALLVPIGASGESDCKNNMGAT
jgi:hypothetical protein